MIAYHGTPITPESDAAKIVRGRHILVSFAHAHQLAELAKVVQSFILDNGAFTTWRQGRKFDFDGYRAWVEKWCRHPAFDWCLIPDVIDGTEAQNEDLLEEWMNYSTCGGFSVPVWHLHESIERFESLCRRFDRVALGSSGQYSQPGTAYWWNRMAEAMEAICDENGQPSCKLHLLRGLDRDIFTRLPLSSADAGTVALNIGIDSKWVNSANAPKLKATRGVVLADNIEAFQSAERWHSTALQEAFDLSDAPLLAMT